MAVQFLVLMMYMQNGFEKAKLNFLPPAMQLCSLIAACRLIPLSPLFRVVFPVVISSWFCHWQWSFPLRLPEASIEGHVPTHTSELTNELDFTCWCSDISAEVEGYE